MSELITFDNVTITYAGESTPALRGVSLDVEEGELVLVVGRTGSGKSTLLQAINGSVPHFTGGTLAGHVRVVGRDTREHRPRDLADMVGVVGQDPAAGFVTDTVEEELAYGMEQLGLSPDTMRKRVEETLDLLGLADVRDAALTELSGGQQQRVAIGAVLTTHPRVLVLDEPTSALDPTGADDVLAAITRLVHDLGVTVVLAEHRIERVIHYADRIVHVDPDGTVVVGAPADIMRSSNVAPAIVELGRYAGWAPLPLSVRDARRAARPWRERLTAHLISTGSPDTAAPAVAAANQAAHPAPTLLQAKGIRVTHGTVAAVRAVSLDLPSGQIVALMGRNGSGKSSLLWALQGTGARAAGTVTVTHDGTPADPARLSPAQRRRLVGLVPQSASDLLYLESVHDECAQADRESGAATGTCATLLAELTPGIPADRHPRDLSEGQRLALVLAITLTADPPVVLLDEPTRGLDYTAKRALSAALRRLSSGGRAILLATHDVEFAAGVADRVIVLAAGDIVADGPSAEVVAASPAFAPQVSKILAPAPVLTLDDVRALDDEVAQS